MNKVQLLVKLAIAVWVGMAYPATAEETEMGCDRLSSMDKCDRLSLAKNPPATTASERLAQQETPPTSITNVQVNSTPNGLEVILNTTGTTPVITTSSYDQTLLIDILDAQLASQFQQEDPIPGITSITVTPLYNNSVRVTIKGETSLPIAQITPSPQGVVVSVAGTPETAQVPATLTPVEPLPEVPEIPPTTNEEFELVVTGEQDGYRVPNTSVGTRTDTPIRDIPQSIQVVPQEVLRDQQVTRLEDALRNVAGVNQAFNFGPIAIYSIRGFDV